MDKVIRGIYDWDSDSIYTRPANDFGKNCDGKSVIILPVTDEGVGPFELGMVQWLRVRRKELQDKYGSHGGADLEVIAAAIASLFEIEAHTDQEDGG